MNNYEKTRNGRSIASVAIKKENVELGKKEHGIEVGKHIAESNYRHSALDMIHRQQHLKAVQRSHYNAQDADDEAEISEAESQHIAMSVGNSRRQSGLRELTMRESASLKPIKKKKHVRSKLFDYEQSQGQSRRRLLRHQMEELYTDGSGSILNVHNFGTDTEGSAGRNLNETATGSFPAIRRLSLADESQRRHSFVAEPQHLPPNARSDMHTHHDHAKHLLTPEYRKKNQNHSQTGHSGSKSPSESWFESTSSSQVRKNSTGPGLSSRIASDSGGSSSSQNSSMMSMDGRHNKLQKNSNQDLQRRLSVRKNSGLGAKRSKPQDDPHPRGQVDNGKHSWAPNIPSQLASSNPKLAGHSRSRPAESMKGQHHHHEKRRGSGHTSKKADAHHVSLTEDAMEEFRELISDPSYCLRFECIPDVVGPVCSRDHKTRRRMMALELLLKQVPGIKQQLHDSTFDPYEMLSCSYLRLSANNIKTLVEMCREAGLDVDYHPHMDKADLKLNLSESTTASSAIPNQLPSPEGNKTSPPTKLQKVKKSLPNGD